VAAAPPVVALPQLERAVREQFGLSGGYQQLISERDQNYHLTGADGNAYVVKVTSSAEPGIVSEFQIAALLHLECCDVMVPRVIRTLAGHSSGRIKDGKQDYRLRVVSYLPGVQLASVPANSGLAHDFGARLAQLDNGLKAFAHPGDRPVLLWDLHRAAELRDLLRYIGAEETRHCVARALLDFENTVLPGLAELRTQVIHGDANPGNVIIDPRRGRVDGFIDFGDMVRAPLIFDVAIAAAYLRGPDSNPMEFIKPFVAGYSSVLPLLELEQALLYDLVRARLATTISLLFWRLSARQDDDPYRQKTLAEEADAIRFLGALNTLGRRRFAEQIARRD
jgi:Ser/Thr protein kinase RdoA (MazF antagonist)